MIVRERRGRLSSRLIGYVTRTGVHAEHGRDAADTILINAGLSHFGTVPLDAAKALMKAAGRNRTDLRHQALHLVISPDPEISLLRGKEQSRQDCLVTLSLAMDRIGVADRLALASFHGEETEHLHAVIALPCPETGRSIPQHRLRERLRDAVRDASHELGLERELPVDKQKEEERDKPVSRPPEHSPWPEFVLPPFRPTVQVRQRSRKRDRGIER
ncbi:hypothetical protein [Oceanibaculum nanhaiense]|uniref:hypothetical protein n=1 Tax=Oceanibaculum nanhaiense TaxID=1909734 RepID=UPI003D28D671